MQLYTSSRPPTSMLYPRKASLQAGYTQIVLLCVTFLLCTTMILMFWISRQPTNTISDKSVLSLQKDETLTSAWIGRPPP